eukprot:7618101-Ditylum_brightwellii.AAC.1
MPRRSGYGGKRRQAPPPLDPDLVSAFHDLVLNGHTETMNQQLASTPRLSNAKSGTTGLTPLM